MSEGKIIEYIDQKRIILSVCLKNKGNKLQLLTSANQQVSISPKRALLITSPDLDVSRSREELLRNLKEVEKRRHEYMSQISVPEIWELTYDESGIFTYKYLAQLAFGENITDDHVSALFRVLFADRLYFKLKDGNFIPNSPEKIEQLKRGIEAVEKREKETTEGSNWLKAVTEGKNPDSPPSRERIVEILIQLALYGKEATEFKQGREMFSRAGIKNTDMARNLLVRLGIWGKDENLDIYRLNIRTSFPEKVLEESEKVSRKEMDCSGREDITNLTVFTIDGPFTRDLDDALSLDKTSTGYRLGVHITDLTPFIPSGGYLDLEAMARASSVYLPDMVIPMLPPHLSGNMLSLIQGSTRTALSMFVDFDDEWNILDYRFKPTVIESKQRLTYEQVNSEYENNPVFSALYSMSQALKRRRIEKGAMMIPLPEVHFDFNGNSVTNVRLLPQDTPSKNMVSESMILYNRLAAEYAHSLGLPVLYRSQDPPQERLSQDDKNYIYYVFRQRRKIQPLFINTVPKEHSGLGVDMYINATSPLRRHFDLLMQRQLVSVLCNEDPPYSEPELKELRMHLQPALKDIEQMKRNRIRYLCLKYLSRCRGEAFDAVVFQKLRNKYLVILTDLLFVAELPASSGLELEPGEDIRVVVRKAEPWDDLLVLEPAAR